MFGKIKDKLITSKQKWAEEGRLLTGQHGDPARDRLPPGQRLVNNWPVLDLGIQPAISKQEFNLTLDGLVETPTTLDWQTMESLGFEQMTVDIHCVTAWSRYENSFEGVPVARILDLVRPKPEAKYVLFEAHDGYTTNLKREIFEDDDCMLAVAWEGEPLSRDHGGPARIVVPKVYFWKSTKWVKRITWSETDKPGFWEVRGYHNEGDPWREERYSD